MSVIKTESLNMLQGKRPGKWVRPSSWGEGGPFWQTGSTRGRPLFVPKPGLDEGHHASLRSVKGLSEWRFGFSLTLALETKGRLGPREQASLKNGLAAAEAVSVLAGLQPMQGCAGLLDPDALGPSVGLHHFLLLHGLHPRKSP